MNTPKTWTAQRVRQESPTVQVKTQSGKIYTASLRGTQEAFITVIVWVQDNPGLKPHPITEERFYIAGQWAAETIANALNNNRPLLT